MAKWTEIDGVLEGRVEILPPIEQPPTATPYGELPVADRLRAEHADLLDDQDGGHFRMRNNWCPAYEGYGPGRTTEADLPGDYRAQDPEHCAVCGGWTILGDVATKTDLVYFRFEWDPDLQAPNPDYRPLGPLDTCGGCLRQGAEIAERVALAAWLAEERQEQPDAWRWVGQPEAPVSEEQAA